MNRAAVTVPAGGVKWSIVERDIQGKECCEGDYWYEEGPGKGRGGRDD